MNKVNSEKYWDERFETRDWERCSGCEQTEFFARIALERLPGRLRDELSNNAWSIADLGCAEGDAAAMMALAFPGCSVTGLDFSDAALRLASSRYRAISNLRFEKCDIYGELERFDVVFCSNVLEHLEKPLELLSKLCAASRKYALVLLPFEDELGISEHINIFDGDNLPLSCGGCELVDAQIIDCTQMPGTLWPGKQILLCYESRIRLALVPTLNALEALKAENEAMRKRANAQSAAYELSLRRQDEKLGELSYALRAVRRSRLYRMTVLLRRVRQQLFGGRESRGDLIRFFLRKLGLSKSGKALSEFDLLYRGEQIMNDICAENRSYSALFAHDDKLGGKNTRQFFIFAAVPYYDVGGGQRSAQLCSTLNAMGYRVYYIYAYPCSESAPPQMYIPALLHRSLDSVSVRELNAISEDGAVYIFELPHNSLLPYLELAAERGFKTVYEHIDNWDSALGNMFYDEGVLRRFVSEAALCTVTARNLGDKLEKLGRKNYLYSPNSVDITLFEPSRDYDKPADMLIGKRTLIYFGSLWGEWMDWDKIEAVAKSCDCKINIIGDCSVIKQRLRTMPGNVGFLGIKKHEELPAYLKYSDIALLPFKADSIGSYVSPLKVFEYIAMDVPVLSTCLPDIAGYPNVYCSDDTAEWVAMVKKGLSSKPDPHFTAENNWFTRCEELMEALSLPQKHMSVSAVVLNRNNKDVIFRAVGSLLRSMERYKGQVIVVDNDSTDGSYELLSERYGDKITLLKNEKNGCSSGRNLGVQHAEGEYIFFMDSDQWTVSRGFLDAAAAIFDSDDSIGAVSWGAGWFGEDGAGGPISDYLPNRGISAPWVLFRKDVGYLATDGFLVKKSVFDAVGGFDTRYDPTCFEDTDLSLKLRHAGYELAYCPYMPIMHKPHQTTGSGSIKHKKQMERNGSYFLDKWRGLDARLLEYRLS